MSEKEKNIYQRILGVMADVEYIQKSDKKVNGMYRFVSHDQVSGTLHPSLVKHGICVIPNCTSIDMEGNRVQLKLNVKFVNVDDPEEYIEIDTYGHGIDNGDKGIGKAYSYAYKYALLKMFCLETGDDADNDASSKFVPPKKVYDPNSPPTDYQTTYFAKELERFGKTEREFFEDFGLPEGWEGIKQHEMKELLEVARERYTEHVESI